MVYCIAITLAWLLWHLVFRIRVVGREYLIHDRGFVIVANHLHALDPTFVVLARYWGKRLLVLAKEELFHINWFYSWFFRHVGVRPVQRGKGDTDLIDDVIDQVRAGSGLLIFPEGTRSKDGNLGRLKSGAFVVAAEASVDIIPCRVIYKGGKLKLFGTCTVVFGKPIPAQEIALGEPRSAARLRECKALVADRLEQLLEENKKYC